MELHKTIIEDKLESDFPNVATALEFFNITCKQRHNRGFSHN